MKSFNLSLLLLVCLFFTGCANKIYHIEKENATNSLFDPKCFISGLLYSNFEYPSINSEQNFIKSINRDIKPLKKGESCVVDYLSLIKFGKVSIAKAMNVANITKISDIQYIEKNFAILLYNKYCVVVYGE